MTRITQGHQHTMWAVLDRGHHVVVLLQGADAVDASEDWLARGYRVVPVPHDELAFGAHVA